MQHEPLIAEIANLLHERPERVSLAPGGTGGNNRIFIVTAGDRKFIAKSYFRDTSDTRNRLKAEFEFLSYARHLGLRSVPQPVASNPASDLGIYEFVAGRKLAAGEIDEHAIDQAIAFFLDINRRDGCDEAAGLPSASEACYTINEHLMMVDQRIDRLAAIPEEEDVDRAAHEFARALADHWVAVKADIRKQVCAAGDDPDAPVIERCVSPSDFGFHNAILRPSGEICFIDFEYAGWDDPAKMAGDFFSHPAVSVNMTHYDRFLAETMRYSRHAAQLEARARLYSRCFRSSGAVSSSMIFCPIPRAAAVLPIRASMGLSASKPNWRKAGIYLI